MLATIFSPRLYLRNDLPAAPWALIRNIQYKPDSIYLRSGNMLKWFYCSKAYDLVVLIAPDLVEFYYAPAEIAKGRLLKILFIARWLRTV